MKQFGPYKIIEELVSGKQSILCKAQNDADEFFAVKAFLLPPVKKEFDKTQEEILRKHFYSLIELQKRLGEESPFVAPILLFGSDDESVWFVTRFYPISLQSLILERTTLNKNAFFTLIESIVRGALDFKELHGRSHGNLKPTNVFLTGDGKNKLGQVLLSDPLPGDRSNADRFLASDLRSIGEIIYRLVNSRDTRPFNEWKISTTQPSPEWITLFGKNAQAGAILCKRLLDSGAVQQGYSLEKLLLDLLKLKPRKVVSPVLISVICGVAVLGVAAGIFLTQSRQTADLPRPEIRGVETAAREQESSEFSDEDIRHWTKEKRLAEERAAEARSAAEKAQKEAAERHLSEAAKTKALAAELERKQREAREATERATQAERLQREAELRRLAEEEKTRALASELQRKSASQAASNTNATRLAVIEPRATAIEFVPERLPLTNPKPGERWNNSMGMKFVPIPNTKILLSIWETRRRDFETFVTVTRYNADQSWKNTAFKQTSFHPVVNVSAKDADAFCKWLTEVERGKQLIEKQQFYRLPSEEEWIAALGDKGELVYGWGSAWPPPAGAGNYATSFSYDPFEFTAPIAQFLPNRLGIYDLGGNVWEICAKNNALFARGGSWQTRDSDQARVSFRLPVNQTTRHSDVGFRCVLDLVAP